VCEYQWADGVTFKKANCNRIMRSPAAAARAQPRRRRSRAARLAA
jgi:hypothetical protein